MLLVGWQNSMDGVYYQPTGAGGNVFYSTGTLTITLILTLTLSLTLTLNPTLDQDIIAGASWAEK